MTKLLIELCTDQVAPAFGQIGGGVQLFSPVKLKTILDKGVLKEIKH